MPQHYEISRLTFRPNGIGAALPTIERSLAGANVPGRLAAVWTSELGALNEVMIVHAIDDAGAALAFRDARARQGDIFGVGDQLVGFSSSTYASFPTVAAMPSGQYGPAFEVREYDIKPTALPALLAAWEAALPGRIKLSPLITAAYGLDGAQPKIMHIWSFKDLVERARIRGEAVATGVWPPKGGADFLATMRSSIYLPTTFSPLQ